MPYTSFHLATLPPGVIVTCPVGSNHLKHSNRALLLPGPTLLFYERETVSRDCSIVVYCLVARSHTCNFSSPPPITCHFVTRYPSTSWESKVSFCNFCLLPSFLPFFVRFNSTTRDDYVRRIFASSFLSLSLENFENNIPIDSQTNAEDAVRSNLKIRKSYLTLYYSTLDKIIRKKLKKLIF